MHRAVLRHRHEFSLTGRRRDRKWGKCVSRTGPRTQLYVPEDVFDVWRQLLIRQLNETLVERLEPLNTIQPKRASGSNIAVQSHQIPGRMVQEQVLRLHTALRNALITGSVPEVHDPSRDESLLKSLGPACIGLPEFDTWRT